MIMLDTLTKIKCDFFFFQAEYGILDRNVTGVQTCALPILAQCDAGLSARELLEDGIEPGLRTRALALRAVWSVVGYAKRRRFNAAKLVALEVRHEHTVEPVIQWETPVTYGRRDAELPAELHRPHADHDHLGRADLVVAALDEQCLDSFS